MYAASDPLTWRPRRILVTGVTGSGKSTFGRAVQARVGIPRVEMDALHWGEGWTQRPDFVAEATAAAHSEAWVAELQYTRILGNLFLARADTLVWLDLPQRVSFYRLLRRTVRSSLRRELICGSVREPPLWTIVTDRDHILRWWWRTRKKAATQVPRYAREFPNLHVVRLRTPREVADWIAQLDGPGDTAPATNH